MRLIDADEVRKHQVEVYQGNGVELETIMMVPLSAIDNAPTVKTYCYYCGQTEHGKIVPDALQGWRYEERKQSEWIPVSERLPEEMQDVLIWFEYYRYGDFNCMYQTYGLGYVCDGKWSSFINGRTGWKDYNIIAWQPLPEPYKGGER